MTIKPSRFGSLFVCLCAGLALAPHALFSEIGVPRPKQALQRARLVAVGSITPGSGDQPPQFTATKVLKGTILPGRAYIVRADGGELQENIKVVVKRAGSQPILFLGAESRDNSVCPIYGGGSVWPSPRYLSSDMLTPDNLEDCIKFAETVLGIPQEVKPSPQSGATAKEPEVKPQPQSQSPAAVLSQAVKKPVENKPTPHHEPAPSTPRIVLVVLAVAALGLLWRLLKRHS